MPKAVSPTVNFGFAAVRPPVGEGRLPAHSGHFVISGHRCLASLFQSAVEIFFTAEGSLKRTIIDLGQSDGHGDNSNVRPAA
jgi:hypothetical protein